MKVVIEPSAYEDVVKELEQVKSEIQLLIIEKKIANARFSILVNETEKLRAKLAIGLKAINNCKACLPEDFARPHMFLDEASYALRTK